MKEAFRKIGKSYAVAAAEIGCSKPRLVAVINHGEWPKKGAAELRESLKQYFEKNGAAIPASLRNEPETAPAQATDEDKDDDMLLRKATLTQATRRYFGLVRDPFNDEIRSAEDVYMTPDVRYVREAMVYLEQNCGSGDLSVGQAAAQLGLSEGHLSHLFKKETDMTLGAYLTRCRIQKAMALLREGKLKVYEVAEACGYRDIAYFSGTFKKITGKTPSEYQDSLSFRF